MLNVVVRNAFLLSSVLVLAHRIAESLFDIRSGRVRGGSRIAFSLFGGAACILWLCNLLSMNRLDDFFLCTRTLSTTNIPRFGDAQGADV